MKSYKLQKAKSGVIWQNSVGELQDSEAVLQSAYSKPAIHVDGIEMRLSIPTDTVDTVFERIALSQIKALSLKVKQNINGRRTWSEGDLADAFTAAALVAAFHKYLACIDWTIQKMGPNAMSDSWTDQLISSAVQEAMNVCKSYENALPMLPCYKDIIDRLGSYYFDKLEVCYSAAPAIFCYEYNNGWYSIIAPTNFADSNFVTNVKATLVAINNALSDLLSTSACQAASDILHTNPNLKLRLPVASVASLTDLRIIMQNMIHFRVRSTGIENNGNLAGQNDTDAKYMPLVYWLNSNGEGTPETIDLVSESEDEIPYWALAGVPTAGAAAVDADDPGISTFNFQVVCACISYFSSSANDNDYTNDVYVAANASSSENVGQLAAQRIGFGVQSSAQFLFAKDSSNDGVVGLSAIFDDRFYHHPITTYAMFNDMASDLGFAVYDIGNMKIPGDRGDKFGRKKAK